MGATFLKATAAYLGRIPSSEQDRRDPARHCGVCTTSSSCEVGSGRPEPATTTGDPARSQLRRHGAETAHQETQMSNSAYRHRRIQAQLDRWGVTAGVEPVRQLTCEPGLEPCRPRPKRFNLARTAAGQVPDFAGDNTSISTGEAAPRDGSRLLHERKRSVRDE